MQTVVIVIHLLIVLALIGVVLLQKSEGGALGMGCGGGFMTSRGTGNVLTKTTAWLAGAFFITSLALSVISGWGARQGSIFKGATPASPSAPGPVAPAPGRSILDQIQPATPAAPPGPQVPQSK